MTSAASGVLRCVARLGKGRQLTGPGRPRRRDHRPADTRLGHADQLTGPGRTGRRLGKGGQLTGPGRPGRRDRGPGATVAQARPWPRRDRGPGRHRAHESAQAVARRKSHARSAARPAGGRTGRDRPGAARGDDPRRPGRRRGAGGPAGRGVRPDRRQARLPAAQPPLGDRRPQGRHRAGTWCCGWWPRPTCCWRGSGPGWPSGWGSARGSATASTRRWSTAG